MALKDFHLNFGSAETIGRSGNCFLSGKYSGRKQLSGYPLPGGYFLCCRTTLFLGSVLYICPNCS